MMKLWPLEVSARMLTRPWGGGRKSWLVKPSITAWLILAGVLLVLGLLSATVAWRVQALPRQHATALLSSLAAEHEAMWASVWGHLPARSEGRTEGTPSGNAAATLESNISYASWGWSLWPRPQVHLMDVRWSVPAELSSSGQLHLERLTLGLAWASLWTDVPRLHDVRAEGLAGSSRHTPWGLLSEWRLQEARLSSVGEGGVRRVSWTMESSLRPVRPAVPAPALDPTTPWLAGVWTGQARWHPMQPVAANRSGRQGGAGESEGEGEPAHWQQVDLRFRGQLGGRPVSSAHLSVARWMHNGAQERLAWDDLVLGLQLGEGAQAEQLELRSPALDLGPDSARGQGWSANGSTAVPLPLSWQMDSAPPRGRYTAVTWPRWRLVPSGRDGSRAGGQLQADLSWFPDRRSLRWDALLGELSLQPRGEAERQWSLRGQLEVGARASSWQLEGQAHGGSPDSVAWDGPFATEGEWRRWPQPHADVRLSLASLWPERLWTVRQVRSAAAGDASSAAQQAVRQPVPQPGPQLVPDFWSSLASAPGELRLQVGQLAWRDLRLTGVEAQFMQQGDTVQMPAMRARLWGGALSAQGSWQRGNASWQLSARNRDADLGLLRQTLDNKPALSASQRGAAMGPPVAPPPSTLSPRKPHAASGRFNGTAALRGRADDMRQLQGSWSVDVLPGHWQGLDLRAARDAARENQRDVGKIPSRKESPTDQTTWRRLLASGQLDGGVAQIDRMALAGASWRMGASGTLDLQAGTWALGWFDGAGERPRGPVLNMSGPWRTPQLQQP